MHQLAGKATERILRLSLEHKAIDNVTGVLIVFERVKQFLNENGKDDVRKAAEL